MAGKKVPSESKPETRKGFKGADYNAVATAAHLESIRLISQRFDINPECLDDPSLWKLEFGRQVVACTYHREDGFVAAIIRFEVTAKQGRKRALKCLAEYGVMYSVPDDAEEEAAMGFCRNVGSFAIYPYFRALVAQLAWNAEISLPPLPSIASTAHIPPKPPVDSLQNESSKT